MTKRELIETLEALDVDDDTDIILDEDHNKPGFLVDVIYVEQDIYLCN